MQRTHPTLVQPAVDDTPAAITFRLSVLVPVFNERHVVEASLRRVLAIEQALVGSLEVIIVDDCSTDGTWDILQRLAMEDARISLHRHDTNRGKGACIRTALSYAKGEIVVIHDADLEYNPADIPSLLVPFAKEGADAVFGSRYLSAPYRRALMYRHTFVNKFLTILSNWFTDLTLTDMETCYKAINATLLKSIPIRSNDFRVEAEIVSKLAKRRARIFEAPIRYLPRTRGEGKKIRAWDGLLAVIAIVYFGIVDDIYKEDEYGSHILTALDRARRFNLWMGDVLRPYVGERVLELGAGIGNLTGQFIPRDLYVASDINPNYLHYLRSYAAGKPYLRVVEIDILNADHFRGLENQFDTVLVLNVLEHVRDAQQVLRNVRSVLVRGGRAVILVPQHPGLYGSLDEALGHHMRYTEARLREALTQAGFRVDQAFDFNRFSAPGWWVSGKLLRRKHFSRVQLKLIDMFMPVLKRIDRLWPWTGISVVVIAVKTE